VERRPWFETYFENEYLRLYPPEQFRDQAGAEVEGIIRLVDLSRSARILDLCCGYGRHAIEFAQRGFEVTGFDLSQRLLDRARVDAERHGVKLTLVQGDMRDLSFSSEFDVVVNLLALLNFEWVKPHEG
jgi:2-polyprenyl-3-methyl-5-hydroxy-6-metoxy-1,4-benzoquinol methylase